MVVLNTKSNPIIGLGFFCMRIGTQVLSHGIKKYTKVFLTSTGQFTSFLYGSAGRVRYKGKETPDSSFVPLGFCLCQNISAVLLFIDRSSEGLQTTTYFATAGIFPQDVRYLLMASRFQTLCLQLDTVGCTRFFLIHARVITRLCTFLLPQKSCGFLAQIGLRFPSYSD